MTSEKITVFLCRLLAERVEAVEAKFGPLTLEQIRIGAESIGENLIEMLQQIADIWAEMDAAEGEE